MRKLSHIFFAAATTMAAATMAAMVSCGGEMYDNSPREAIELSHGKIIVGRDAATVNVGVTAREGGWTATGGNEWCVTDPETGPQGTTRITVTFTANDGEDARERRTTLRFASAGKERTLEVVQLDTPVAPDQNPDYPINEQIHSLLAQWYYNGEARSVEGDYNQSYDDFYENYLGHLARNDFDGNYWANDGERYLYSYIERHPTGEGSSLAAPLNYGMEFDLAEFDGRLVGRVLYVEEGSPAHTAGLKRGDWFHKVNGTAMGAWTTEVGDYRYHYNRVIDSLVRPVAGESPKLSLLAFNGAQETLTDRSETVTLTPAHFSGTPIFATQNFTVDKIAGAGGVEAKVGYMMYNRFDEAYRADLVRAFGEFKVARPDYFILDLRYNKSGSVEMANLMGNLLVGNLEGVSGRTFAEYVFDGGAPAARESARFAPHDNSLGAGTVFVLTSRHTAGAAELLVNALRGLDTPAVKVVVIGEITQGMAAGMVRQTHTADGWDHTAWILAFRVRNDAGGGDYNYGLVPNSEVNEWQRGDNMRWQSTWGWKGNEARNDGMVKRAVDMIRGSVDLPSGEVVNASMRRRTGYPRRFCFPTNMTTGN